MGKRRTGLNTLSYLGVEAPAPPNLITFADRAPTTTDNNHNLGTLAINLDTSDVYMLTALSAGSATWTMLGAGGGGGGGTTDFVTDSGTAMESGNAINILGGSNIGTTGASDNVTVNLDSTVSISGTFTAGSDITSTAGDLIATAGDITATAGALTAGTTVGAGTSLSVGTSAVIGTTLTVSGLGAGVVQSDGAGLFSSDNGSNGQVLIGGGAAPAWANITSTGATITITNGANTINLETSGAMPGGGINWNEVTGTSSGMSVNNGYIANNAAQVTLTLPDTAALGSVLKVVGKGAGGWRIAQNAGESIIWDEAASTTTGVGGYLESTDDYDAIEIVCTVADTTWTVLSSKGNITVA